MNLKKGLLLLLLMRGVVYGDIVHAGHPLQRDIDANGKPYGIDYDKDEIKIVKAAFPSNITNAVTNSMAADYRYGAKFTGNNHAYFATIWIDTPNHNSSKISVGQYYWNDGNLYLQWVSENLLFIKIWWGRHWGSDYIYNTDTLKIIYSDAFGEPRVHPKVDE